MSAHVNLLGALMLYMQIPDIKCFWVIELLTIHIYIYYFKLTSFPLLFPTFFIVVCSQQVPHHSVMHCFYESSSRLPLDGHLFIRQNLQKRRRLSHVATHTMFWSWKVMRTDPLFYPSNKYKHGNRMTGGCNSNCDCHQCCELQMLMLTPLPTTYG